MRQIVYDAVVCMLVAVIVLVPFAATLALMAWFVVWWNGV